MTVLHYLEREVQNTIQNKMEFMARGNSSYEEYVRICAEIKGLRYACDYIRSLSDKMELEDE